MGRHLSFLLVLRGVDEVFPLLAVGRGIDFVAINRSGFFPVNPQRLNMLGFGELDLPVLSLSATRRAPARAEVSVDGVLREVVLVFLFTDG